MGILLEQAVYNLISPPILAFVLGLLATFVKSDLRIPEPIYQFLSIYLLFSIGLKGGVHLGSTPLMEMMWAVMAILLIGVITTTNSFFLTRWVGKLDRQNAAALAAHFGSVSVVTFMVGSEFVRMQNKELEAYFPAMVAVLEFTGILVALLLLKWTAQREVDQESRSLFSIFFEAITTKGIFVLLGGMLIGMISGPERMAPIEAVFVDPFLGVLLFFLLEMGILAAQQLKIALSFRPLIFSFGILFPLLNACIGILIAYFLGFGQMAAFMFGLLAASASYIAAPAVARDAFPKATASLYLGLSLGIVFPFNLSFGIPTYYFLTQLLYG